MKTKNLTIIALCCALFASSCSKEDDTAITLESPPVLKLNSREESKINATSIPPISYESENNYHATVSDAGLITAQYVGETNINLSNSSDSKRIRIFVEPMYDLYETPLFNKYTTRNSIIAQHGKPDIENNSGLAYKNYSSSAYLLMYLFDDNGNYVGASVMVKTAYSSTLSKFLLERYAPIDVNENEGIIMYANDIDPSRITLGVALKLYNLSYWQALYVPIDPRDYKSKSTADIQYHVDKMFNSLNIE